MTKRRQSGPPTSRAWQQQPTSSQRQPDNVPSKSLPPLGPIDRMPNGEKLGWCPRCGGDRWWDNRSRKAAGQIEPTVPDYRCVTCRHDRAAGAVLTPPMRTSVVPKAAKWNRVKLQPANAASSNPSKPARAPKTPSKCAAVTRDRTPCKNKPMKGSLFCGPHADVGAAAMCLATTEAGERCGAVTLPNTHYCSKHWPDGQCHGTTKAGAPCRAGAQRGSWWCPQHEPSI